MYFAYHQENANLIERLEHIVENNKVSHAYIFEGPDSIDKKAFAESFIKGILCPLNDGGDCGRCGICRKIEHGNHEDIIYISADGKSIKDAAIIKMQDSLKTRPFGDRHIVIIEHSDTMTLRAQNRLLKTLEEPPGMSVIILLSENMENLIPTIQSRCVKYRINHFGSEGYDFMLEKAEKIVKMLFDREAFYRIKKETEDVFGSSRQISGFLDSLQVVLRNMLLEKRERISLYKDKDIIEAIHHVETARKHINEGVSPAYAIKNLLIKIGG